MLKIVSNKIRCKFCGDILESFSVHDFKQCRCGKCSNDGGLEYTKRSFATENPEDTYEDLSIYVDENGKLVNAKDAAAGDIPVKTPRVEIKEVNEIPEGTVDLRDATATEMAEAVKEAIEEAEIDDISTVTLKPEVIEESEDDEPLKEEKIVKRDKNGKPIAGRYPYGKKE